MNESMGIADSSPCSFLVPGQNCWCVAEAKRFAVIVDAARYFEAVTDAIERAERTVFIVGWDLHGETPMRHQGEPATLAAILAAAARRRPDLAIRLLVWDFIFFYALERELFPTLRYGWTGPPNIQFRFAKDHPIGGSHHQKIVVVDDAIAFAGGIDLTVARWDLPDHDAHAEERRLPNGMAYSPLHDVQVAVSGEAARRLGELARRRWRDATGEELVAPALAPSRWPETLAPDLERVKVGIARTAPATANGGAIREVRALYLDMIASARRSIYVENQYLTAACIREALGARLREPEGPEVVIVTPMHQLGRLEVSTLGALRMRWLTRLRHDDLHGRLRVVHPLAAGDPAIWVNVHAKVMIVDDEVLRVGSANFTNRSMGLDTECDIVLAADGDPSVRRTIARIRTALLAHHIGGKTASLPRGSLVAWVDEAAGERLACLNLSDVEADSEPMVADEVVDPFEPMDAALFNSVLPSSLQREGRRRLPRLAVLVIALLALAAAWTWTPLNEWVEPDRLAELARGLQASGWGPLLFVAIMTIGSLLMVPITALIVAGAVLFGPVVGGVSGMTGSLLSAMVGFALGRGIFHDEVRRHAGPRIQHLSRAIQRRGVLSVLAVRLVPVAPFTVVNVVAGSSHVRFRDFLIGTLLGMAPGLVGLTVAADRVAAAVRSPSTTTIVVAATIVVVVAAALFMMRRWLTRVAVRGR
jgi:phospholipase D1/2